MWRAIASFVRGLSSNWVGGLGVALTTASFLLFLLFVLLTWTGILTNAYVGLLSYMTLPACFVAGLLLIAAALAFELRRSGLPVREFFAAQFGEPQVRAGIFGSNVFLIVAILTGMNILFLGVASTRMLHFMDRPAFCGTACHVMDPEWTAYLDSPHARVACVDCHVGDSPEALVASKLNGLRQMALFATGSFSRPIPTPVHQLRPSRETCRNCHWAELDLGTRLRILTRYASDAASTPLYSTLNLKIGPSSGVRRVIHWHASDQGRVRFASVGDEREKILWLEAIQEDGTTRRYTNRALIEPMSGAERVREMDCVDCHNRVTHVYEDPAEGIDRRIRKGLLDRQLPYIRREAFAAVIRPYPDRESALEGIERSLTTYYQRHHPALSTTMRREIEAAVEVLQAFYARNVFHAMRLGWNSYPDHMGHPGRDGGCFRCHNRDMRDERGQPIDDECTLCHSILANDSLEPFAFQKDVPERGDADTAMHEYLKREFLGSLP